MKDSDLRTRGWSTVDKNPFLAVVLAGARVGNAIVLVESAGSEVGGRHGLANKMGFSDPAALSMREDNTDGVAGGLEFMDEGVHVGRRDLRGRAVVVDNLILSVVSSEDSLNAGYQDVHFC